MASRRPLYIIVVLIVLALMSCQSRSTPTRVHDTLLLFVRDGLAIADASPVLVGSTFTGMRPQDSVKLEDQRFVTWHSAPGDKVYVKAGVNPGSGTTPVNPSPWSIASIPLGDIKSEVLRGNLPDTSVAVAGTSVAVGTFTGELVGTFLHGKYPPFKTALVVGGMVKTVAFPEEPPKRAFPPDGSYQPEMVYSGEQSTRGRFHCLAWPSLEEKWHFDISEDLGEGKLPGVENPYGIYSLPAVWQIETRLDGVYFVGVHSRINADGTKTNLSRMYAYDHAGTRRWAWPADGPAPVNMLRFDVGAHELLIGASRSAEATSDPQWPDRSLYFISRDTGTPTVSHQFEALPGFEDAPFIWQGLSVLRDSDYAAIGLSDGRAFVLEFGTRKGHGVHGAGDFEQIDLGTPIEVSGVQLTAPVSYALIAGETAYFHTGGSNIPPGVTDSQSTPPAPHPGANTLTAVDLETGKITWQHREETGFNGLATDALGRWLVTTTGNPTYPDQEGGYGVLVFDTVREGSGADRIVWKQPIAGAPFFNFDISSDGFFIAVTETPVLNNDGVSVTGEWTTHVYH